MQFGEAIMRCLALLLFMPLALFSDLTTDALAQPAPPPRQNQQLGVAPPAEASTGAIAGEWTGTYVCAQGITRLRVVVRQTSFNAGRAVFHFFPGRENPTVPEGCFSMAVAYDAQTESWGLKGDSWLRQPKNYVMVDLLGAVDAEGKTFAGAIVGNPLCSRFNLTRAPASRPLPSECNVDRNAR
jgi:hypothetical protein